MTAAPAVLHALLAHLADALAVYVRHQIDSGAQACRRVLHQAPLTCGKHSPISMACLHSSMLPIEPLLEGVKEKHA